MKHFHFSYRSIFRLIIILYIATAIELVQI